MRRTLGAVPALIGTALLIATAPSAAHPARTATTASAHSSAAGKVVKTRHGKLGTFLVDGRGRTLYLFEKDTTRKSRCSGACAAAWPPLITSGKPRAKGHAKASLLGTSKRKNGTRQVTYNGHPLYRFIQDTSPGQTNGEGSKAFGAGWYVVAPSGKKIED
jgi:predicted lipoprotein with Yx(FWY)xxD motif